MANWQTIGNEVLAILKSVRANRTACKAAARKHHTTVLRLTAQRISALVANKTHTEANRQSLGIGVLAVLQWSRKHKAECVAAASMRGITPDQIIAAAICGMAEERLRDEPRHS
jgi:hypothetical protein